MKLLFTSHFFLFKINDSKLYKKMILKYLKPFGIERTWILFFRWSLRVKAFVVTIVNNINFLSTYNKSICVLETFFDTFSV